MAAINTIKKVRSVLNIGDKLKGINLLDSGEKIASIARKFGINESSIRTIRINADKIHQSVKSSEAKKNN